MALEGTLDDMSLSDLFQIFQMGEKTGILVLNSGFDHALVYVHAGRLIDAALYRGNNREALLSGEAAVLQLLGWKHASFTFTYDRTVAQRSVVIRKTSNWLVLEARRKQVTAQHDHYVITLRTVVEPGIAGNSTDIGLGLDLDQWRILDRVLGPMDIETIGRDTRIAPHVVIEHVTELVATGLLQIVLPQLRSSQSPRMRSQRGASVLLQAIQRRVRAL